MAPKPLIYRNLQESEEEWNIREATKKVIFYLQESEEEEEASTTPVKETRGRKRKSKGATSRRRFNHRSLYESSSGRHCLTLSPSHPWPVFRPIFQSALGEGKTKFLDIFLHMGIRNKKVFRVKNFQIWVPHDNFE